MSYCCLAEVVCPPDGVPSFVNNTMAGTTNLEEVMATDPENWNKYKGTVTFTCPLGSIIEQPAPGNTIASPAVYKESLQTYYVADCPPGYYGANGHVPDASNSHEDVTTIEDCAEKCTDALQSCASFEYFPHGALCQLNTLKNATDPPLDVDDYAYCVKTGEYLY